MLVSLLCLFNGKSFCYSENSDWFYLYGGKNYTHAVMTPFLGDRREAGKRKKVQKDRIEEEFRGAKKGKKYVMCVNKLD